MNKTAVITGICGFIGSNLADALVKNKYDVRGIDDLSVGKYENIYHLVQKDSVTFVQGNINNQKLLNDLFAGADYIFHNAAINRMSKSIENPLWTSQANIMGTLNVLVAARDAKVKKVVHASSSSILGNTTVQPTIEELPPAPASPYGVDKTANELFCRVFQDIYGLQCACLRYHSVYGKRQIGDNIHAAAIPKFLQLMAKDERPEIYGDGSQTRDFTYIKDIIQACILFAENEATGVYNISSGKVYSLNEVVAIINKVLGKNLEPIYSPVRQGDMLHNRADISKAKGFGYKPKWDLEDGIRDILGSK
jgi:UDP-glucose 4-epimerase